MMVIPTPYYLIIVIVSTTYLALTTARVIRQVRLEATRGYTFQTSPIRNTVRRPSRVMCYAACLELDQCVSMNAQCDGASCLCSLMFDVLLPNQLLVASENSFSYVRPARVLHFPTPDGESYQESFVNVTTHTYALFSVKGCQDCMLCLSEEPLARGNAYEIVIGKSQNRFSVIRPQRFDYSEESLEASTTDILACGVFRRFWLSWDDHTVKVGMGWVLGHHTFMTRQDSAANFHPLHYLAVGGYGTSDVYFVFV